MSQLTASQAAAPLVLRLGVGAAYVLYGAQKLGLLDPAHGVDTLAAAVNNYAGVLAQAGIEPAGPLAWATVLVWFFGGAFLILGFLTRPSAIALIVIMSVEVRDYNVAVLGALVAIVLLGPGMLALDNVLLKFHAKGKEGGKK